MRSSGIDAGTMTQLIVYIDERRVGRFGVGAKGTSVEDGGELTQLRGTKDKLDTNTHEHNTEAESGMTMEARVTGSCWCSSGRGKKSAETLSTPSR